jgi:hypothetical protein
MTARRRHIWYLRNYCLCSHKLAIKPAEPNSTLVLTQISVIYDDLASQGPSAWHYQIKAFKLLVCNTLPRSFLRHRCALHRHLSPRTKTSKDNLLRYTHPTNTSNHRPEPDPTLNTCNHHIATAARIDSNTHLVSYPLLSAVSSTAHHQLKPESNFSGDTDEIRDFSLPPTI